MKNDPAPETGRLIELGELEVEFVVDGQTVRTKARAVENLFPRHEVVFEVSDVSRKLEWTIEAHPGPPPFSVRSRPLTSDGPEKLTLSNGVEVAVVPSSWLFTQEEASIHLAYHPSVVFRSGNPMGQLEFKILNFQNDMLHWPITLEATPWLVRIEPVPNLIFLERELRSKSGYAVTHTGAVARNDGKGFDEEEAQDFLNGLDSFLSFICGSSCAVTHVSGADTDGKEAWKRWGSHHVAPWSSKRTWADITLREHLPEMFLNFWQDYTNAKEDVEKLLGWYIFSNQAGAVDICILLNHSVIELLTYITSGRKPREKSTGDWIAEHLQDEGIDPKIPSLCKELTALSKRYNLKHGPHALVKLRNSLIHPNSTIQALSMDAYHEAQQLGLWYTELLLLKRFKYEGKYASRLTPVQMPGATEPVPWTTNKV